MRIGTSAPGPGDYMMTSWRHLECQKKPKGLADLAQLAGLGALSAEDQARVKAWYESSAAGGKKRAAEDAPPAVGDPKKMKAAEMKAALKARGLPSGKKAENVALLQEAAERERAEEAYAKLSVDQLKELLALNGQLRAGAKQELVDRAVDGKLHGALPRCTLCGGGLLRVRYETKYGHGGQGAFSCPGFYDDDEYKRCSFAASSVARAAWKEA